MNNKRSIKPEKPDFEQIRRVVKNPKSRLHFIGIGGVSMSSLARLVKDFGTSVSGSDRESGQRTRALADSGAQIFIGHNERNVIGASLVVYTHAIEDENPELSFARANSIPTITRADLLGTLMLDYKGRIGVAGSHGKSTTVAMLDAIFSHAGCEPTTLSGADLPFGDPMRRGQGDLLIYEACEYRDSFLRFSPTIALGLNLEMDHPDYFKSLDHLKSSFTKALGRASVRTVISGDDHNLRDIKPKIKQSVTTFGFSEGNDYRFFIDSYRQGGFSFSLTRFGQEVGSFDLNIPGGFNLSNAAAAITVALEYGLDIKKVAEAIADFRGIPRRLEYLGEFFSRAVYYDYAHHPTEISSSINALKSFTRGRLCVVFKPHTYSRTAALWNDFCSALSLADSIIITDIYPAREEPINGITAENLAKSIDGAIYLPDSLVIEGLKHQNCQTIALMGAGDMEVIKEGLICK